jgi:IS5 family transposase
MLQIMARIVSQQRGDKNKVYSLHAPETSCIAKGKAHKKYELGSKVSVASFPGSNVVVGISSFTGSPHDSKTLSATIDQVKHWTDRSYERVLCRQGLPRSWCLSRYRGDYSPGRKPTLVPMHIVDINRGANAVQR